LNNFDFSIIFQALNIETEEDVTKLTTLFHHYGKHFPKVGLSK